MSYPLILEPHGKIIAIRLTNIEDKKHFVSSMKKYKGRWNSKLKGGMGWTFPDDKKEEVELFMTGTNNGRAILEKKQTHSTSGKVYHRADTDDSSPNSDGPGKSTKEIKPVSPPGSKSSPHKTSESPRRELKLQSISTAVDPQPVKADVVPEPEKAREDEDEHAKKSGITDDVIEKLIYSIDNTTTKGKGKGDDYNSSDDSDYKSGQSSESSSDSSSESSDSSTSESHKHKRHNTTKHGRSNARPDIFNGRSRRDLEPLVIESETERRRATAVRSKKDSKYKQLDMGAKKYKKKFVESSSDYSSSSEESDESDENFPDPYAKAPKNRLEQDGQLRKLIEQNSALKRKEVESEIKLKKLEASMALLKSHRQSPRKSSPSKEERRRRRPDHRDEGKVSERKRSGKRR